MSEEGGNLLYWVVLALVLISVVIFFVSIFPAFAKAAQKKISPTSEEKEENIETALHVPVGIVQSDRPHTKVYKLLKNFDSSYLNETKGNKVIFNVFILDVPTKYQNSTVGELRNNITYMIYEGLKNFSTENPYYQIGSDGDQPINCGNPISNGFIDYYDNDCWTPFMDSNLGPGTSCSFYVHEDPDGFGHFKFDGRIKIRVGWYFTGAPSPTNNREIIHVLVTACDDYALSI